LEHLAHVEYIYPEFGCLQAVNDDSEFRFVELEVGVHVGKNGVFARFFQEFRDSIAEFFEVEILEYELDRQAPAEA
jgi:hypothetical protein